MKSLDVKNKETMELCNNVAQALREDDGEKAAQAFFQYAQSIESNALSIAQSNSDTHDMNVLKERGVRTLTAEERTFYEAVKEQLRGVRQSMNTDDMRLPETVIESVLGDVTTEHPLLEAIDFTATSTLTRWQLNAQGAQEAVWGKLSSEIVKELNGNVSIVTVQLEKLSAFYPISQDWIDVGAEWLDRYIREILAEAIALGAEKAIIGGNGLAGPIGMTRDLSGAVDPVTGYPEKDSITVNSFSPYEYGALVSRLLTDDNGKARDAEGLVLICNPIDYYTLIMPATTMRIPTGEYVSNIFPVPTQIIKSSAVESGTAILGLAKRYWFGFGAGTDGGKVTVSDEYKFVEDLRYYKTKLYGNGRAKDNNAFIVLDISALQPAQRRPETTPVMSLLTVTSSAGTATGDTAVTITEDKVDAADTYKYKVFTGAPSVPVVGTKLGTGYTAWNGTDDITAATGSYLVVAEVDASGNVKAVGYTVVTAKA